MVIEYARHVAGLGGASSSEFDPDTEFPVIATMAEQVDILDRGDMGGTMRLGLYPADLAEGSLARELYGAQGVGTPPPPVRGQQPLPRPDRRCRALCSRACRPTATWSSTSSCRGTCTRSTSRRRRTPSCGRGPTDPHPLFRGLVGAAIERQRASELFEVAEPDADGGRRVVDRTPDRRAS